jgi:hypothetical protein
MLYGEHATAAFIDNTPTINECDALQPFDVCVNDGNSRY